MSQARCEECGFDYEALGPADIPASIRAFARRSRAPLSRFLPGEDGDALAANAERLAATVESVPEGGWDRVGLRRDEERSVLVTARRAVHEGSHHLLDIGRGLRAVRDQRKATS